MPKFPEPPSVDELKAIPPSFKDIAAGTELWRIYFRGGRHPVRWNEIRHFGPTLGRFDPHEPPPRVQKRAAYYASVLGPTCFAEVFQETRVIDRVAQEPWLVAFKTARAVRLLDLTRSWPTRAGTSMAINSGSRKRAQRWARAIWAAYPDVEGIFYASSMYRNSPCVCFWERAKDALPKGPAFHRSLADPGLLEPIRNAARDLGYLLV
jgi:hypothetical protein